MRFFRLIFTLIALLLFISCVDTSKNKFESNISTERKIEKDSFILVDDNHKWITGIKLFNNVEVEQGLIKSVQPSDSVVYIILKDSLISSITDKIMINSKSLYSESVNLSSKIFKKNIAVEPPYVASIYSDMDTLVYYYNPSSKDIDDVKYVSIGYDLNHICDDFERGMSFNSVSRKLFSGNTQNKIEAEEFYVLLLDQSSILEFYEQKKPDLLGEFQLLLHFKNDRLHRLVSSHMSLAYLFEKYGEVNSLYFSEE